MIGEMKMRHKLSSAILAISAVGLLLAGCSGKANSSSSTAQTTTTASAAETTGASSKAENTKITILADVVPHSELLEFVKPKLAEEGIDLNIVLISDSTSLDRTDSGEVDANFFAHLPYLESVKAELGYDLASAGAIHVEPIGAYSTKYTKVEEIPDNATIAIPNDGTNEYRALRILEKAGFIELPKDFIAYEATINDIVKYVRPITIKEIDSAQIIRIADDFDVYITNTNKILESGIDASTALFREEADSPYANIIITKTDRVNDPAIQKIVAALRTEEVRKFIEDTYKGAVIPAF